MFFHIPPDPKPVPVRCFAKGYQVHHASLDPHRASRLQLVTQMLPRHGALVPQVGARRGWHGNTSLPVCLEAETCHPVADSWFLGLMSTSWEAAKMMWRPLEHSSTSMPKTP